MAGQGSARVTLREIDLSQVRNPQQQPQGVPAAVVGPASKGPAFVPRTFANMQQFEEVFGSMRERGYQGNANLFGPMALNEWMRSASAGTYLRVLGVGDGLKSSGGKTTDAGFVVGAKQVQEQSNDLGKLDDNPHASIEDSTAALSLGRTQFLGCFMKDSTGSNFLKDAGMESEGAAAKLTIDFQAQPQVGDTIKLDAIDVNGILNGDVTFTFGDGLNETINRGANLLESLTSLKNAIQADPELGTGNPHEIVVSAVIDVEGNGSLGRIILESAFEERLDSTNKCIAKFNLRNLNPDLFTVGSKNGSTEDETFAFAQTGGSGAKCVVTISDIPSNNSSITLVSLDNDQEGGLTDAQVVYAFKSAAIDTPVTGEVGRFDRTNVNAVDIDASAGKTRQDVLLNLKSALDRATSVHSGKFTTSMSEDGLSLTIEQVQKGVEGRATAGGVANITLTNNPVINLSVACATANNGGAGGSLSDRTLPTEGLTGFFFGGANGTASSFNMSLTDNPNEGDNLELQMLEDANTVRKENFKFTGVTENGQVIDGDSTASAAVIAYNGVLQDGQELTLKDYNDGTTVTFEVDDKTDTVGTEMRARFVIEIADDFNATSLSGAQIGQTITLTNTANTSFTYVVTDTGAGGQLTGKVIELNDDLGGGDLAPQERVGQIAVGVDITGGALTRVQLIDQLISAIVAVDADNNNAPVAHNDTITIEKTKVAGGANAQDPDKITLFQTVGGLAGNTVVVSDIADFTIPVDPNNRFTRGSSNISVGIKSNGGDLNVDAADLESAINASGLDMTAALNAGVSPLTLTQGTKGRKGDTAIVSDFANYTLPAGDTFSGGLRVVAIQLGVDQQETLYNVRNALRSSSTEFSQTLLASSVSDSTDSITISALQEKGTLRSVLSNVINVSEVAQFTNVAGESKLGNFGEKSENFSGGGGAASPVIRGVLMTPQGIRASLDVNPALGDFVDSIDGAAYIRSVAHNKQFGSTPGTNLAGHTVGEVSATQGFKVILNGYSNTQNPAVLNCSFNPNSPSYFAKVLNTDSSKIEELGHYLYAWWDVMPSVAAPSNAGLRNSGVQLNGNYERMIGFLVEGASGRDGAQDGSKPNYENFESKFRTAKTPWIVSQFYGSAGDSAQRPASAKSGDALKLFRLHALDDGIAGNSKFRLLISNLRYSSDTEYGSFDMTLESWDSDSIKGTPLAAWKNASLDPMSNNFIGRLIGDKHVYFDFEKDADKQRLREEGQYAQKNPYVRIELSSDLKRGNIPVDALPTGFHGHSTLFTKTPLNLVESTDIAEAKRIFTEVDGTAIDLLSTAQVAPLDYVVSINRQPLEDVFEADDDLAWGVKFGLRESQVDFISSSNRGHKENQEQVFNKSLLSWTKFFPDFGSNPAMLTDGDDTDLVQNSFFSLEKIEIPSSSLTSDSISSWDGAMYRRDPSVSPSGRFVNISKDANVKNMRYLKFRCMFQGGFDGVNIFDEHKSEFDGTATLREGFDERSENKFTGPTIMSYRRAVDVLSDKSAAEFQLLVLPGQRASAITDYAISACEDRFDALYLMDIVEKNDSDIAIEDAQEKANVRNTIREFSQRFLDTSFAAAYFPDILMRRPSDNAPTLVPPSVGMLGAIGRNDAIADPWFAPAGLNRGRLNAIDSKVQMTRDLLDELYDADINPIYVPAGRSGEVYAFGQKTLLQDQSALDRINVRRLLIDIRRKVRKVGEQLLFEPNRASTLARFSSLVEPIMANVQERRGVARYKVQIDASTTTQADVENNTIRGKIYLQPLKSVEFISLDFVVANNIE